ncbi:hypothetical protein [Microseira wollei]|uniref:Secreted protein n=1 Tax=Microseira wollei NIES-4236 TaxID=2530354 RepID=A0AAV3XAC5_9CYAN|nr:hypothetical protein [Microseira wollei]GET37349.1 hypothetical protein MiSe_21020 [Microseira wollei NIES-4236]
MVQSNRWGWRLGVFLAMGSAAPFGEVNTHITRYSTLGTQRSFVASINPSPDQIDDRELIPINCHVR